MRNVLRVVLPVFILLGFTTFLYAQPGCPEVVTAKNVTVPCGQSCTNLTASAFAGAQTTSYSVGQISYNPPFAFNSGTQILNDTDDGWSYAIPIGFNFCFFNQTYSQIIVGSNGDIGFNISNAGAGNNWQIPAGGIPFNNAEQDMLNTIMTPWQDIDNTYQGTIYYNIAGVAPCRTAWVSWYKCAMFGDPNSVYTGYCSTPETQTQAAALYETSNVIEIYIDTKVVPCDDEGNGYWNNGWAVEGIQNNAGTVGYAVPNRNATRWPTNATLHNDAWRWTPAGAPNYTITWFQGITNPTQIGTGNTINVCPTVATNYIAKAKYTNCDNSVVTVADTVFVGLGALTVADSARQPTCNGSTNGAVYASYNSTSGVISYGWSPGGAGQTTLTNIGAGTYIFTVHDSAGCVKSDTEVLTNPAPLVVNLPNDTATSCTGSTNNGVLNATVTGGTPTYHYSWSPGGATTDPVTGLNTGTYTVSVTDSHGCTGTASANVSVRTSALSFAPPQITEVGCLGNDNGQIIDPVNGGTSPITYHWSTGTGVTDTLSGLRAGTYSVTATDANGCTASASFTISQPATALTVTVPNDTVISCTGQTNIGSLYAIATGGTPAYSYLWSNNGTTDTITGLTTGTYHVTVSDAAGCLASATGSVLVSSSQIGVTVNVIDPICNGLKGEVIATTTGSTIPDTYHWSNGYIVSAGAVDTLNGVASGNFTLTVTDANGCSVTTAFVINQPPALVVGVNNDVLTACSPTSVTGTLTATTTGGSQPYNYVWSNNSFSSDPDTGLTAGTYYVTVTDHNGCTATDSGTVTININPVVFNTPQITNAGCGGANTGEIILNVSGGTAPVTFTWSGGTTQSDTIAGLAGGTYNFTATDVNGCSATASYTVNQSSPITFGAPVITNVTGCAGGANGSISVTATGGTAPITYKWNNGQTTSTITGLAAGGYTVTATDANGCTATAAYNVSQSAPLAITSANVDGVTCAGSLGSITVTASGGTGTLTYSWSGGLTGSSITNLQAGGYTLTVTDTSGCSATAYYIVGHSSCGGCPAVNTNNNVAIPCSQTCTYLVASAFSAAQTTAYTVGQIPYAPPFAYDTGTPILVHIDDRWSQIITLPFNFCFWGTAYNQVVVGSNGEISFNAATNAGAFNNWDILGPIPTNNYNTERDVRNTIMAPWQDLDPTYHGSIYYNISGTAPCRKFEVSWYNVPMYGDSGSYDPAGYCDSTDHQTQMAVLYETTNAIDIYIANKDIVCNNSSADITGAYWNGGEAIEGIFNANGTRAVTVPGRNATQWTAHNDAWRFTPSGAPNYVIDWYHNGALVGTGDSLHVCPDSATTYSVFATYTNCDNSQVVVGDSVYVTPGGSLTVSIDSFHTIQCNGDSNGAVYASYHDSLGTVTSFGWSPGGANQTSLVNIPAGTYVFTVTTSSGCSKSDTVVLTNPAPVSATIASDTFTSCTVNNLGTLTANGTGGTPGYTYLWSNSYTSATIGNLTPGNYTVTVTDSHGCSGTASGTVVRIPGTLALGASTFVNPHCTNNGSITVVTTGGTTPLTYTWNPTEPNSNTLTGLGGGTYNVTVTDAGSCSVSTSFTLTTPVPVVINNAIVTQPTCSVSTGGIIVSASGGVAPLTYAWSPSGHGNSDTLTGLTPGTYTVTVTDSVGCSASASYTINPARTIAADSVTIVNVTCSVQGSITVVDTGGVPPLTYHWSGGQTTDSISGQPAGTYTLTVTDANGCSVTASYTIGTAPGAVAFGPAVITNPLCNGDSGSITVTTTGGQGTIHYVWGNSATTATITGLAAGSYSVTATDSLGCSASATYNIVAPAPVIFGVPSITNVSCYGGSNGVVVAHASGGTGTIHYVWNNGSNSAADSNLTVGTYCVTATDSNGCSASICYPVNQPTQVSVDSSTTTAVTCTTPGQINIYVSGGTPGYTYTWSNGQSGNPITSGSAGVIDVTITDANGCSVVDSVTAPAGVGVITLHNPVLTSTTCNGGNNGSIIVVATDSMGGPITYLWNTAPPASSDTLTGLAGGASYTVTVTDSAGCSATATYIVPQPAPITFNAPVLVQPSCNGGSNGSITANATGGTGTITYSWGAVSGATDTALAAGTYAVTATDSVGCSASMSYTLGQPSAIAFTNPVIDSIKCFGGAGSITVSDTGGTGSFHYVWSNTQTGATASGLVAATYCVTATDSAGCSASTCYTLTQPTQLVIDSVHVNEVTCVSGGTAVATVSGGTPGYTYSWSHGSSTTDSVGSLPGGSLNVTVTDANGCTASVTVTVPVAANTVVIDSASQVNELCHGNSAGKIIVTASGGVGSLTYAWTPNTTDNTDSAVNLSAGTYQVIVSDSIGCKDTAQYTITQPAALVIDSIHMTQVTCTAQGSLDVTASGGTPGYTYQWQGSGVVTDSLGGLTAGTYGVTVTDANGCTVGGSGTVTIAPNTIVLDSTITQPTCNGLSNGSITVTATGGAGGFTYLWSPGGQTTNTITGLATGVYTVTVKDANGCQATQRDSVGQPAPLVISNFITVNATCNQPGSAQVVATGGTTAYSYAWTGGSTANPVTGLTGGQIVDVTVTDHNGCTVAGADTLAPAPAPLTIADSTIVNNLCNAGTAGSISVTVVGGPAGETNIYHWAPGGQTTSSITNLAAGTYYLTVSDVGGCTLVDSFRIAQPAPYAVNVTASKPVVCPGQCDTVNVNITPANAFNYTWSNGATTQTASYCNLPSTATTAGVTATDNNGCTAAGSVSISGAPQIVDNPVVTATPCAANGAGNVDIQTTGGFGTLTYTYNPGGVSNNTGVFNGLAAGNYTYTVTDAAGCSVDSSFTIQPQPQGNTYYDSVINADCYGFSDGKIIVFVDSPYINAPYTYSINDSTFQSDSIIDSLAAGTYTVYVKNSVGCTVSISGVTVGQPGQQTVTFTPGDTIYGNPNTDNPLNGQNNSNVVLNTTNFVSPVYSWTPSLGLSCTNCANPTANVPNPMTIVYYVTVSDSANQACKATDSVVLVLVGPLAMPSAFSPNGDGKNDLFGPVTIFYVTVKEFHIYNRWGQLVHNSTDYWDGKFDGKEQPDGTYIYYIEATYLDPISHTMQTGKAEGSVTLLR